MDDVYTTGVKFNYTIISVKYLNFSIARKLKIKKVSNKIFVEDIRIEIYLIVLITTILNEHQ